MDEKTNLNILENATRGMMGATLPMVAGLMNSGGGLVSDMLNGLLDTLSSIDLGEMVLSVVDGIIPMVLDLLDPLLNLLGPAKETALNIVSSIIEKIGPLMGVIGPLVESIKNVVVSLLRTLIGSSA